MVAQEILNEIIMLKARCFELDEILKERNLLYNRLIHLSGKAEGIVEVERLIDAKVEEALEKTLEARKVNKKKSTPKKAKVEMQKPEAPKQ